MDCVGKDAYWREVCYQDKNKVVSWSKYRGMDENGNKLYDYCHSKTFDTREEAERAGWYPLHPWKLSLPDGWRLTIERGQDMRLSISGLWRQSRRSRYRLMVEAVTGLSEAGVIKYHGKADSYRGRLEAMRHRLKATKTMRGRAGTTVQVNAWWVDSYEHNIHLERSIGLELLAELRASGAVEHAEENTLYLTGWDSKESIMIKAYDTKERPGSPLEVVKLEVTLRKGWLTDKDHPERRRPEWWLFATDIQENARKTLMRHYGSILKAVPNTVRRLEEETEEDRAGLPLLDFILARENTLTEINRRLEDHERRLSKLERLSEQQAERVLRVVR